jgi:hypothetical protein
MTTALKLFYIKLLHTIIWIAFNVIIFYFVYTVIIDEVNAWTWICLGLIGLETLTLMLFKTICPVTLIARKYSNSKKDNFDIFLPNWLARHNKLIYSVIVFIGIAFLIYRLSH